MEAADEFFKVIEDGVLNDGEGRVVRAGLKKIALFKLGDEYHATQNFCPHAGGFLGLGEVKDGCVRCPRHAWRFDIRTGECHTNPRYDIRRYTVKVEDGWVLVGVPSDGSLL